MIFSMKATPNLINSFFFPYSSYYMKTKNSNSVNHLYFFLHLPVQINTSEPAIEVH